MVKLTPSILNVDFIRLSEAIEILEENGVENIHLDIMDGNYVPNISFGPGLVKSIRKRTDMILDAHLMIENPDQLIDDFIDAGVDYITVHPETTKHLHRTISHIKAGGAKPGIVLNPSTPLNVLDYVLEDIEMILLMSVNPGFGGQSFIKKTYEKIGDLKEKLDFIDKEFIIQVDGGIKIQEATKLKKLGANWLVVGSDIFGAKDPAKRIMEYNNILKD